MCIVSLPKRACFLPSHYRELDDEISADLEDEVGFSKLSRQMFGNCCIHMRVCIYFSQANISEDDIDESFKSMFAQLAGEVGFVTSCPAKLNKTLHFTSTLICNLLSLGHGDFCS